MANQVMYFDFFFLLGLFHYIPFNEIYENLQKICESSSYYESDEAVYAKIQLKIFQFIIFQCGSVMKDNPSASLIHLLSRTLNFCNSCPFFTNLINEYDKESPKIYPLVLAHQYIEPAIGELIFQFDKHIMPITHALMGGKELRLILTLSNKIDVFDLQFLDDLAQIKIPKNDHKIEQFIAYLDSNQMEDKVVFTDLKGGFILTYQNEITNINFDSSIKSSVKFENKSKPKVFLISRDKVIVYFDNQDYIEIYDLNNGEMFQSIKFEHKITNICSNLNPKIIVNLENLEVIIAIGFENNEIKLYKNVVNCLNSTVELVNILTVPSPGAASISSIDFIDEISYYKSRNRPLIQPQLFFVSYGNFNFGFIFDINKEFIFISNKTNMVDLKAIDYTRDNILLLGSNKSLFLSFTDTFVTYEINGNFSNGCLINNKIIGVEDENLVVFYISDESEILRVIKLATFEAHYEAITFLLSFDDVIITASRDSTFKIFYSENADTQYCVKMNFHKASSEINELINLDEEFLVSKLKNSK